MRTPLWISITVASIALLGCADDGTKRPQTNNATPNTSSSNTTNSHGTAADGNSGRTTVSKPAIGGGETPATSDSSNTTTGATGTNTDSKRPDNSGVNERDRNNNTVLPTDQSNDQKDLDLSAKIRQNILRNKEMSVDAQNVKIITTDDGKVTLRGPVASEDEKKQVEQIAKDAAGADKVTSELEVAPK